MSQRERFVRHPRRRGGRGAKSVAMQMLHVEALLDEALSDLTLARLCLPMRTRWRALNGRSAQRRVGIKPNQGSRSRGEDGPAAGARHRVTPARGYATALWPGRPCKHSIFLVRIHVCDRAHK